MFLYISVRFGSLVRFSVMVHILSTGLSNNLLSSSLLLLGCCSHTGWEVKEEGKYQKLKRHKLCQQGKMLLSLFKPTLDICSLCSFAN